MNFIGTVWALLPALIAIVIALITKEVYISLFLGILIGSLLMTNFNIVNSVVLLFETMINTLSRADHIGIILFVIFLGTIVCLTTKAGGSKAYGDWAIKNIKNEKFALLSTFVLGVLIFVDDYFNCLTVGGVMRGVSDKFKISRAKLAYIIDSTAAPICIIAPISSWAAAVSGYTSGDGFKLFISTIPYNLYALLTIIMVIIVIMFNINLGAMKRLEIEAKDNIIQEEEIYDEDDHEMSDISTKGKVYDLVLPIIFLIISCIISLVYTGGFFDGVDFITAFANCDAPLGLVLGSFLGIVFTFIFYLFRKVLTYKQCIDCLSHGFKMMVSSIIILVLAWTLSDFVATQLMAGIFVEKIINTYNISNVFLPALLFIIAGLLSFSTGTSWGSFGILITIIVSIYSETDSMLVICISSILAGAVFGDHISPISDTTIMASAGARCNHIAHVSSQMPYAMIVAIACIIGYVIAGYTNSSILSFISALISMLTILFIRIKYIKN